MDELQKELRQAPKFTVERPSIIYNTIAIKPANAAPELIHIPKAAAFPDCVALGGEGGVAVAEPLAPLLSAPVAIGEDVGEVPLLDALGMPAEAVEGGEGGVMTDS